MRQWTRNAIAAGLLGAAVTVGWAQQAAPSNAPVRAAPAEYRLGPGDIIKISVYQNPDLGLEARLSDTGQISFPLIGVVQLGGLTVPQAEKRIADGLRDGNFVRQPQVSILISQVRGNQVSVLGYVNRSGRYPIESGEMTLSDMLATAGGVAPTGADFVVLVGKRNGQDFRKEVDIARLFAPGGRADDVTLQNGDVVWVDKAPTVFIYGEVQRPGAFRLERGMTVMQALASGGGLTQRGTAKGMRVHRRGPDGKTQVLQPSLDDPLRDGDVVYVQESLF
jgi:polysaccharide export outer membrane protein